MAINEGYNNLQDKAINAFDGFVSGAYDAAAGLAGNIPQAADLGFEAVTAAGIDPYAMQGYMIQM